MCLVHGTVFAQFQHIEVSGSLRNVDGQPFPNITAQLYFGNQFMGTATSRADGTFAVEADVYGGINDVNLKFSVDQCVFQAVKAIALTNGKANVNITLPVRELNGKNAIDAEPVIDKSLYVDMYNVPEISPRIKVRWTLFRYRKPGYFDPAFYYNRTVLGTTVTDTKGHPIKNARVEVSVNDDATTRWGITDAKGRLTLYMQFANGARDVKVTVTADGYRTKKEAVVFTFPTQSRKIKLFRR